MYAALLHVWQGPNCFACEDLIVRSPHVLLSVLDLPAARRNNVFLGQIVYAGCA